MAAQTNFIDIATIWLHAGKGGDGAVSFHREKFVAAGGPDGGDGGRGGDIIFVADDHLSTLMDFRYKRKYTAPEGGKGGASLCHGKNAENLIIKVPLGTVIKDAESGLVIADLSDHTPVTIAKGGRGGYGNAHFATPTRQIPKFAKPGMPGEDIQVTLELKLIADVGLIGFPNVGKSTLISTISAAKPKIANYHFTTLVPTLGVVSVGEGASFVCADIPGLIEGASEGVGLGHDFLRHVERTRLLVHVVDIAGSEGRDPVEDFEHICDELVAYGDLAERPQIVAANKMDLPGAEENFERLKKHLKGTDIEIYPVSAATQQGFDALMGAIVRILPTLPERRVFEEELPVETAEQAPFTIEKDGGYYVVSGPAMEQLIDSVNFTDQESLNYFHRTLRSRGVIDALRAAGAKEGDSVVIGDMEFDFVE